MMNPGKYRNRVTIQSYGKVPDGGGGWQEEWYDDGQAWAHVNPMQGNKRYIAQQVNSEISHEVYMRYRDITRSQRLKHRGRILEIESIIDVDERKKELLITCKEVV